MVAARKSLDAHKAYNQFRCFAEIFGLLGLDAGLDGIAEGVAGIGLEGGDGDLAAEVERLRARVTELEAENLTLKATVRPKAEHSAAH